MCVCFLQAECLTLWHSYTEMQVLLQLNFQQTAKARKEEMILKLWEKGSLKPEVRLEGGREGWRERGREGGREGGRKGGREGGRERERERRMCVLSLIHVCIMGFVLRLVYNMTLR